MQRKQNIGESKFCEKRTFIRRHNFRAIGYKLLRVSLIYEEESQLLPLLPMLPMLPLLPLLPVLLILCEASKNSTLTDISIFLLKKMFLQSKMGQPRHFLRQGSML